MTAKLEWIDGRLMLGGIAGWALAYADDGNAHARAPGLWRYVLTVDGDGSYGEWAQTWDDATQDGMREVRRLLEEAGVEVAP